MAVVPAGTWYVTDVTSSHCLPAARPPQDLRLGLLARVLQADEAVLPTKERRQHIQDTEEAVQDGLRLICTCLEPSGRLARLVHTASAARGSSHPSIHACVAAGQVARSKGRGLAYQNARTWAGIHPTSLSSAHMHACMLLRFASPCSRGSMRQPAALAGV